MLVLGRETEIFRMVKAKEMRNNGIYYINYAEGNNTIEYRFAVVDWVKGRKINSFPGWL